MALTLLPPELLELICSNCEFASLKSLRLANWKLSMITENWLYREIIFFKHRKSLQFVNNIAECPRLAKYVESLWINGDCYPELDFETYQQDWKQKCINERFFTLHNSQEMVQQREDARRELEFISRKEFFKRQRQRTREFNRKLKSIPLPELPEDKLKEGYEHYHRLTQEALEMERDNSIRQILNNLFKACPNLSSIEFSLGDKGTFLDKGFTRRWSQTKHNNEFRLALFEPTLQDKSQCGIDILSQLFLAAIGSHFSPKRLILNSAANFLPALSESTKHIPIVARKLQCIDWEIAERWSETGEAISNTARSFDNGSFASLLGQAPDLRSLNLIFAEAAIDRFEYMPQLSGLVGSTTWPLLTSFKVFMIRTTSFDLSDFLLRHRSSLQEIELREIFLEAGVWANCFARFAGRLPRLTSIELRGTLGDRQMNPWRRFDDPGFDQTYRTTLTHYLITGEGEFPDPPDDEIARYCRTRSPWIGT